MQRPVESVDHERVRCRALRQPVVSSVAVVGDHLVERWVVGARRAQRGRLFRQLRARMPGGAVSEKVVTDLSIGRAPLLHRV